MITKKMIGSAIAVTAFGFAATASAGFTNEDLASWHGSANSSYYSWDNFTDAGGGQGNASDQGGFNAILFNFGAPGTATIAGSGNLYAYGGPLNIHTYAYADDIQAVQFNISSAGTPFDWAGVALAYTTVDGGQGYLPNFGWNENYAQPDNFGGMSYNMSYSWDLSSVAGVIDSIGVFAESSAAHTSLDAVSIDLLTAAVPAPGALAILGLAGLAGRRRRRM